jgi:hypothetical protein
MGKLKPNFTGMDDPLQDYAFCADQKSIAKI